MCTNYVWKIRGDVMYLRIAVNNAILLEAQTDRETLSPIKICVFCYRQMLSLVRSILF